ATDHTHVITATDTVIASITGSSIHIAVNPPEGPGPTAVMEAPTITSADSAAFLLGTASTFTITAAGNPTPESITVSGTLPAGVTFHNNGKGTATLSGRPAPGTAGTYSLSITAFNGVAPNDVQDFTLTVDTAIFATGAGA